MKASLDHHDRISFASWRVLILLGIAIFINFVDRGNLSIAAPFVRDELHLSATQLGILLSSFFWTYSLFSIPAGSVVDRFDPGWTLACGFLLWSCATAATGLMRSFAALFALRLVLGMTESVAFPAYAAILARNFREDQRGVANSVGAVAQGAGPAAATLIGGLLIARWGWRSFFVLLGLGSVLWLLPWLRWMPRSRSQAAPRPFHVGMLEVARRPAAWMMSCGYFCGNYATYLLLTWLPFYLIHERHFSLSLTAKVGGGAFLCKSVGAVVSGWLSDTWIASGATPTLVRKTIVCCALLFSGALLLLAPVASAGPGVVLLLFGCLCLGFFTPQGHAINQTLAGPERSGTWVGFVLFVSNFSGVIAPAVTGFVLDRTGRFFWAFALMSAVAWTGAICVALVGPIIPIMWNRNSQAAA